MRLVVFGGTGFVGTRVVKAALAAGLRVTAVSRSGKPSREDAELAGAEFVAADVLQGGERMERTLEGADAVISCVGAFGSQQFMRRTNGDANVLIAESARAAGVGRMAYISVQPFRPVEALLRGYFEGKREAEAAVNAHFGASGAILRPGVIFGSGRVPSLLGTPVGALLETAPLRHLALSLGPLGELLTPWLRVEDVALAAVAHVIAGAPVVSAGAGAGAGASDGRGDGDGDGTSDGISGGGAAGGGGGGGGVPGPAAAAAARGRGSGAGLGRDGGGQQAGERGDAARSDALLGRRLPAVSPRDRALQGDRCRA